MHTPTPHAVWASSPSMAAAIHGPAAPARAMAGISASEPVELLPALAAQEWVATPVEGALCVSSTTGDAAWATSIEWVVRLAR